MAVFMMASGYCYSAKLSSSSEYRKYIIRKIKSLYLPFVLCNGCFTLLSPVFLRVGIYTNNLDFLILTESWPVKQSLYNYEGIVELFKQLVKVCLFVGTTQLGTATWFLTSLFLVLIVHSGFVFLTRKISGNKKQELFIALLILMSIISQLISSFEPSILSALKCFPAMYVAFIMGLLIRSIQWSKIYTWWTGLLALGLLICMSFYFHIEVSAGRIEKILVYIVSSLCGWVFLKALSELVTKNRMLSSIFSYLGKHTMAILCLHVICFKIISKLYIELYNLPKALLAGFHIIFNVNEAWKLLYTIVGVGIPLVLSWIYKKSRKALQNSKPQNK